MYAPGILVTWVQFLVMTYLVYKSDSQLWGSPLNPSWIRVTLISASSSGSCIKHGYQQWNCVNLVTRESRKVAPASIIDIKEPMNLKMTTWQWPSDCHIASMGHFFLLFPQYYINLIKLQTKSMSQALTLRIIWSWSWSRCIFIGTIYIYIYMHAVW